MSNEAKEGLGPEMEGLLASLTHASPWLVALGTPEGYLFRNEAFLATAPEGEPLERAVHAYIAECCRSRASGRRQVEIHSHKWTLNAFTYSVLGDKYGTCVVAVPAVPAEEPGEWEHACLRLRSAIDGAFDAMLVLLPVRNGDTIVDFEIGEANGNGRELLRLDEGTAPPHFVSKVIGGEWGDDLVSKLAGVVHSGEGYTEEFGIVRGGETRWLRQRVTAVHGGVAVTARDVSDERRSGQQTREHLRVLENALDGILTADLGGRIDFVNGTFAAMLGQSVEWLVGRRWDVIGRPEERAQLDDLLRRTLREERIEVEIRGERPDGIPLFLHLVMLPRFTEGEPSGHYVFAIDITAQRAYEAQLEQQMKLVNEARAQLEARSRELEIANVRLRDLATTDGLTGLRNHRYFRERLRAEVERAKRYGMPVSILMIDVDFFKQFNDTYGHPAGDEVLRELAGILRTQVRSTDLVARYGGEEFAVIMPQTATSAAFALGERLRMAVEEHNWPVAPVKISAGGATHVGGPETADELLSKADEELYRAKRGGRNRVCFADLPVLGEESA
jgi:diguanylate cyclase (GGDEF)-like protein/PAS domain S-box-containing protein